MVKTHAFGDSLLATPAVTALIEAGHTVTVLSGPSSKSVWSRLPGVENVVQSPAPCSAFKLLRWSILNMQRGYDRVIHFGSSSKAYRWLTLLTGSKVISGGDGVPPAGRRARGLYRCCGGGARPRRERGRVDARVVPLA